MRRYLISATLIAGLAMPALAAAVTPPPSPAFSQKEFGDVKSTDSYYDAVEYLRTRNILKGYSEDNTFRAGNRLTRAEFLSLVTNPLFLDGARANECIRENVEEGARTIFYSDVMPTEWYADPVCWGTVKKIVNGYPDGTFKPNKPIMFIEAAKMVSTVFQLQIAADDSPSDAQWYTAYVQELARLNAIPTTVKKLDQTLTRAEMAEILYRIHSDTENKPSMKWTDFPKP